jgi:hypothetical protein
MATATTHAARWLWSTATSIRSTASGKKPKTRAVDLAIVVDLIHVLEYLWGAVRCFFAEGDPARPGMGRMTGPWPCSAATPARSPPQSHGWT